MNQKNTIYLFFSLVFLTLLFNVVLLMDKNTIIMDVDITAYAYSREAKKSGHGKIESTHSVKRYHSSIDQLSVNNATWNITQKYYYAETYPTQTANFSLLAELSGSSVDRNWASPSFSIDKRESHIASISMKFKNVKSGTYELKITLFLQESIEDIFIEKVIIP